MASQFFPHQSKLTTLSDGTTYGYVSIKPSSSIPRPTFLFLHGYPSSSYDWRHQIKTLSAAGYGVIAPDLLGYGDTDKPVQLERYALRTMAYHIRELLDLEGVERCIGVSHDWGSVLNSRLANYIPERLYGLVALSVGYVEPGIVWDVDSINKFSEATFGYPAWGYWPWHNTEEAVSDCDNNPASVFSLLYPSDSLAQKEHMCPPDAAATYVKSNTLRVLPPWYTLHEYTIRDRIFSKSGYHGPLSWYKSVMRGINDADEAGVTDDDKKCKLPVLLILGSQDYITRAEMASGGSMQWVSNLRVEVLECGHWVQLELPERVDELLVGFEREVVQMIRT